MKLQDEILKDATEVIEDLLHICSTALGAYGYGISNELWDKAMVALGQLDALRGSGNRDGSGYPRDTEK